MSTRTVSTKTRMAAGLIAFGMLAAACGDDEGPSVAEATERFCTAGMEYVAALDAYGRLFVDEAFTVGDVKSGGDGLDDPRDEAESALDDLEAANEAASATESTAPVSDESTAFIDKAEEEFADTVDEIDDDTPLTEAATLVSSAAFQLQVAWLLLVGEVGCIEDLDEWLGTLTGYVAALQTDLATLGYYDAPVDGIYGPQTVAAVKALQKDVGLPETGLLDRPTQAAMAKLLEGKESAQVAALQGLLSGLGYWNGPIDGIWTDELGDALAELQADLGLPPTGTMNAATLLAIQDALAAGMATGDTIAPTPTQPPATQPPATQPPATQPPATQPPATQPPVTQPPGTEAPAITTVIDVLTTDGRFTTLLEALEIAELTEELAGDGPFTVFAPIDDAFDEMPADELDALLEDPVALRALLLDHVLDSGAIASDDLVAAGTLPTAGEGSITVTDPIVGGLLVNDTARIVTVDLTATNGVVHAIDAVLPPQPT